MSLIIFKKWKITVDKAKLTCYYIGEQEESLQGREVDRKDQKSFSSGNSKKFQKADRIGSGTQNRFKIQDSRFWGRKGARGWYSWKRSFTFSEIRLVVRQRSVMRTGSEEGIRRQAQCFISSFEAETFPKKGSKQKRKTKDLQTQVKRQKRKAGNAGGKWSKGKQFGAEIMSDSNRATRSMKESCGSRKANITKKVGGANG